MVNTCNKDKVIFWENKAKNAVAEKNKYAKEIRRIKKIRDKYKAENSALKLEVKSLKKRQSVVEKKVDMSCAVQHQYPIALVLFCVHCQRFGTTSLRSCQHMIVQLVLIFGLSVKVPTHTTIRNWVCKCGYHRGVAGHGLKDYDAATRWGLWVDESMTMGGQKLLLILGRPVDNWAFEESLSMATIHVLYLNFAEQWLATDIAPILKNIDEVHKIAYIVSDNGANLVKSYEIGGFIHISDLTHTFANGLERHYKKNDDFNNLFSGCTALRQKWTMSKTKSTYMPPSQRGKVRFANIFPTILWAHALPSKKEALPLEIQPDMAFIFEHQALTNELYEVHRVIGAISTILKISGFSVANTAEVEMLLATLSDTPSIRLFVAEIYKWLNATEVLRQKIGLETIFCCSDIIESTFGKFKQKTNVKSSFGMTEFVLIIANFGQDFSTQEIRDALEQVKLETIADWRPDIKSIFQKKKAFFQK